METTVTQQWFKNNTISKIVSIAEQLYGRERVINLIQYSYNELNAKSTEELDRILANHRRELDELCKPIIISEEKARKYHLQDAAEFNSSLSTTSITLG